MSEPTCKSIAIGFLLAITLVFLGIAAAGASTKVHVENNRVRVQENGITQEYGRVREVKTRNGTTEIYTSKNYSGPAVTVHRNGSITTKQTSSSASSYCKYSCAADLEDEDDE
ncbi:hypothetical protein P13BB106kb_p036 [Pectobacterium phage DU_PP_V]|uniref:Uncharacterized protein n=1 Tax=Pectobacterium phage DU_PP_V TaxID=2041492 RepID=A0A2D2W759_9CAUD|nr:hypothetical protein HOS40_gp036 [Pectobacterium phage DU_PP_V]ATS94020.1 hypothetical protein P13BB106kb_p036 [Pectobacterium phage DU_PP_V]